MTRALVVLAALAAAGCAGGRDYNRDYAACEAAEKGGAGSERGRILSCLWNKGYWIPGIRF